MVPTQLSAASSSSTVKESSDREPTRHFATVNDPQIVNSICHSTSAKISLMSRRNIITIQHRAIAASYKTIYNNIALQTNVLSKHVKAYVIIQDKRNAFNDLQVIALIRMLSFALTNESDKY